MIQHHTFTTGGFVLHRIPDGTATISAWFDYQGTLLDHERISLRGRSGKRISKDARKQLDAWGRTYMPHTYEVVQHGGTDNEVVLLTTPHRNEADRELARYGADEVSLLIDGQVG